MWYKILSLTISVAVIAIFQITFLGAWHNYFSNFNLAVAVLVIALFLVDFKWLMAFILVLGFTLDIYSSLPFGIFMFSLFSSFLAASFLLFNFITNRSFYSVLSLGLAAWLTFNLVFLALASLAYALGLSDFYVDKHYGWELLYQFINTAVLLIALFFTVNFFSNKFKPNFLRS